MGYESDITFLLVQVRLKLMVKAKCQEKGRGMRFCQQIIAILVARRGVWR